MSDFIHYRSILDTIVRFITIVSDFRHNEREYYIDCSQGIKLMLS